MNVMAPGFAAGRLVLGGKRMNRWLTAALLVVLGLALALRLPRLGERPLHTDESVHALKFLRLWQHQGYRYDPHEYHGPSLYYASLPFAWLSGASTAVELRASTLRLVPLAFGLGLIVLLPLLGGGLGRGAVAWAALFTAVSPVFVYYSRYYIHELLLVFFTLLLLAAGWRYLETRRLRWALLAGAALGLMYATKETFVFNLVAMAAGATLTLAWGRWREGALWFPDTRWNRWHVAAAAAATFAVSLTLFTSFFTNARGPLDSLLTYAPWFSRAGGSSPHLHPAGYYLEHLFWFRAANGPRFSELLIAGLAVVGFVDALRNRRGGTGDPRLVRFLGFYSLTLAALYAALPYKTPWCALGFHHGFILLAGVGAATILRAVRPTWLYAGVAVLWLAGAAQLASQAVRATGPLAADRRNPWVYAHTSANFLKLISRVHDIAAAHRPADATVIKVIGRNGDYWPLPWYLRGFPNVGYFAEIPPDPWAPLMIVSSKFDADLDEKSGKRWLMVGLFEQRPNVFFELYVELELWKQYLATRPPTPDE